PTPTPTPAPNQPGKAVSTAPSQAAGPAKGVSRTLANTGVQVTGILGASALLLAAGAALVVQRNRKQNG
ncbi:LPXTG cell wall anchor domain-containing protein, partial [Corynebacterium sp. 70RC1]